ncbi:undecaprenyl-diphosphatase [Leifsonia sp. 98AMF]|uniref:undecaprenyl-diphosphate phosphatase n=1 Tax=unclassified Leifsonia TaxID=2663824 RepID=UPI000879CBDE|nr:MULTISPECIES: undecaprenyl-diphosphate phosphatase [unclassified Leifsonia]SDH36543.1 undecaprenyl-diphosphatase [Leifsonia sp. 197AMF]SDI99243.1 undecaprenyl-diphosphatase [Leifsonia sp. 466MF]SDJ75444.1 Undecaprenyl-diphosphatase [Leifsonia sp. 157MF]SDO02482.1 undecaprenyl-diphosphatase [Leifsonia sp. 509MF]SEN01385.1 undecaprenyl-diphosphatase [Leifsonia sp. 467MF]
MDFINALILGLVQGLTEFLPISSSAHIRIVGELLGTGADPGARFTAIIQLGTEAAVLLYFWRDITRIIAQWFRALFGRIPRNDPDARMGWLVILGSIPIVVLGLFFQDQIETTFRSLWIVATTLIVFGILLGIADWVGSKRKRLRELTWGDGIIFGLAQALALIPGVSRSGGTITAGLFMGYQRRAAARYSFLLALPAVFGSGFYQLYKAVKEPCTEALAKAGTCTPEVFGPVETAAATVVAFVVGLLVIAFFMGYISRRSFLPFVIYRIALGVLLMILLAAGVLQA